LQDRLDSTRCAWGLATRGITCLVIVEMGSIAGVEDLSSAITRYFEKVSVVAFDGDSRQPWRLLSHAEAPPRPGSAHPFRRQAALREGASADELGHRVPSAPPSLRLVDHRQADEGASSAKGGHERDSEHETDACARDVDFEKPKMAGIDSMTHDVDDDPVPSVTRDEIAMLLRGDAEDDNHAPDVRREAAP
jgi:hypothetical protein